MACERQDEAHAAEESAWGPSKRAEPRHPEEWEDASEALRRASNDKLGRHDQMVASRLRRMKYESFSSEARTTYAIHLAEGRA